MPAGKGTQGMDQPPTPPTPTYSFHPETQRSEDILLRSHSNSVTFTWVTPNTRGHKLLPDRAARYTVNPTQDCANPIRSHTTTFSLNCLLQGWGRTSSKNRLCFTFHPLRGMPLHTSPLPGAPSLSIPCWGQSPLLPSISAQALLGAMESRGSSRHQKPLQPAGTTSSLQQACPHSPALAGKEPHPGTPPTPQLAQFFTGTQPTPHWPQLFQDLAFPGHGEEEVFAQVPEKTTTFLHEQGRGPTPRRPSNGDHPREPIIGNRG